VVKELIGVVFVIALNFAIGSYLELQTASYFYDWIPEYPVPHFYGVLNVGGWRCLFIVGI
jgi:hypothetical protein